MQKTRLRQEREVMLYIFRCMMTTHVVVQDDEPYITTGDRPMCDYCYDMAEEGSS